MPYWRKVPYCRIRFDTWTLQKPRWMLHVMDFQEPLMPEETSPACTRVRKQFKMKLTEEYADLGPFLFHILKSAKAKLQSAHPFQNKHGHAGPPS